MLDKLVRDPVEVAEHCPAFEPEVRDGADQ
jgi:hypothetical protein